jgi:hypothetical protein
MVEIDLNETNALVAVDGEERAGALRRWKMAKVRKQRGTHRRHACLRLSSVWIPGTRRSQGGQEYSSALYCPAGQWAAVNQPGSPRRRGYG